MEQLEKGTPDTVMAQTGTEKEVRVLQTKEVCSERRQICSSQNLSCIYQ
jgi:hypothetical protein